MWMHLFWTRLFSIQSLDSAAIFPGRFPNVPESMWKFGWIPQTMGLQGQFCGGDVMNQQSQAQSQAQTQAQLAYLREQNSILNQQLASQVQSHIQHLQQLISFHQSTSTPPHSTSQVSEPPTPVALTSTNLVPVYPSIQKRWCNRWNIRSNPLWRPLRRRTKSAPPVTLHHPTLHHFQLLHQLPAILSHQLNFHLHIHPHIVAPDLIATALAPVDRTNVHSPSIAVLVDRDSKDERTARLDHVHHQEGDVPHQDLAAELLPSLFGKTVRAGGLILLDSQPNASRRWVW